MNLSGAEIILNRSSTFVLDGEDDVSGCKLNINRDDGIGTDTPIIVRGNAVLIENVIQSEMDYPILQQSPTAIVRDNVIIHPA
jgi:hypothetical protein